MCERRSKEAYPEENIDIHTTRENLDAITYLQYQLDEALINETNQETHNEIMELLLRVRNFFDIEQAILPQYESKQLTEQR